MNKPLFLAGALAVAAVAVAAFQSVSLRRANVTIDQLSSERDRLGTELKATRQRLDAMNQRVVQAELQSASLKDDLSHLFPRKDTPSIPVAAPMTKAAPGVTTGTTGPASRAQTGFVAGNFRRGGPSVFRSTPTLKALETTYHVLYRQLQLSPEQIEQYKVTMAEATARFEELESDARRKRVSVMDKSLQPLFAKADADLRAKLTGQFGAAALPVIEQFTETLHLRDAVAHVAQDLFYTSTPLTEPQANQLVDILAKNLRDPAGRLNRVFADAGAMKAEAETVLSPPQAAVWREFIDSLAKSSFAPLDPQPMRR